jgi:hypothetical protein
VIDDREPDSVAAHLRRLPVGGRAAWHGPELESSDAWLHRLSDEDLREIDAALHNAECKSVQIAEITPQTFPLPRVGAKLHRIAEELFRDRGFILIRRLPTEHYTRRQLATIYWGIGAHIGCAVPQNGRGHLLGHVRDLGYKTSDPKRRGYQTSERLEYHTDSCDVVGLLCLQPSMNGGESTLVSATSVHDEILRTRPDLLEVLYAPFWVDRRGEIPHGLKPYYSMPVFHWHEGELLCNYESLHVQSAERFSELPRMSDAQREALALVNALANDSRFNMRMAFGAGDIQFLNNHRILHSRAAYEDFPEPERKRHLLRLWLVTPSGPALPHWFGDRYGDGRRGGIYLADVAPIVSLEPA